MYSFGQFSRRGCKTSERHCSLGRNSRFFGFVIACLLGIGGSAPEGLAQVAPTDGFTPRSWQPGAEAPHEAAKSAKANRRPTVTTTTRLEEFEVPRRSVRRSATPRSRVTTVTTTTRIVERKRTPRRVRVAALGNTAVVETKPRRVVQRRAAPTRVAALGGTVTPSLRTPSSSLTGGAIAWRASSGCLASNLRSVVASLAANHGAVTVNSTCRSARHNRRVGGAKRSWHLTGNAVDFRIHGASVGRVYAYLRGVVGGLKHYGGGRFHIDNGPRRTF